MEDRVDILQADVKFLAEVLHFVNMRLIELPEILEENPDWNWETIRQTLNKYIWGGFDE